LSSPPGWTRTSDHGLIRPALSPLSYGRKRYVPAGVRYAIGAAYHGFLLSGAKALFQTDDLGNPQLIVKKSLWLNSVRTNLSRARIPVSAVGGVALRNSCTCLLRNSRQAALSSSVGRRVNTCSNAATMNAPSSPFSAATFSHSFRASSRLSLTASWLFVSARACCGTRVSVRR